MYGGLGRQARGKALSMHAVVYPHQDSGLSQVVLIANDPNPRKKRSDAAYCVAENLEVFAKTDTEKDELDIVVDMIQESVWKEELVDAIRTPGLPDAAVTARETQLRKILTSQYDTQLRRQEHEVRQIESRVAALRNELQRRKAAKDRVVDVKLGRIVLEAQGLLDATGNGR